MPSVSQYISKKLPYCFCFNILALLRKEQLCIIFVFVLYLHPYFFTNLLTEGGVTLCLILYLLLLFLSWQVYLLIIFANGQIDFLKSNQPIKKDRIHGPVFSLCKLYLLFAYTPILNQYFLFVNSLIEITKNNFSHNISLILLQVSLDIC